MPKTKSSSSSKASSTRSLKQIFEVAGLKTRASLDLNGMCLAVEIDGRNSSPLEAMGAVLVVLAEHPDTCQGLVNEMILLSHALKAACVDDLDDDGRLVMYFPGFSHVR